MSDLNKPGIYKHYKGGEYQLIDHARHSETEELMVLYRPLYGERLLWVRPAEMFYEQVEVAGKRQARFEYLRDQE